MIQQSTCGKAGKRSRRERKEKGVGAASPTALSREDRSTDPAATRGGVPVFIRPIRRPRPAIAADSPIAAGSSQRPASRRSSPTWIRPRRKVPPVTTAARHETTDPSSIRMPVSRSLSTRKPPAVPDVNVTLAVDRTMLPISFEYNDLSD